MIELVARDGSQLVGSRCNRILGSKHHLDKFESRLRNAMYDGLTRCEISLHLDKSKSYNAFRILKDRKLPETIKCIMDHIVKCVLN